MILGVIEEFGGKLNQTNLQKILFLVTRKQQERAFDFVPYKFGCFSFQANQDLLTMHKLGEIQRESDSKTENWIFTENIYYKSLRKEDQAAIKQVKRDINGLSQKEIIRYTYLKYPYYASKSQIAEELLEPNDLHRIKAQVKSFDKSDFFTIGYEGISLENYLNKLIINDIKLLCDVRKNPISMKYGFSKSQLLNACESIGIKYLHLPELGVDSEKRTDLKTLTDYNKLFDEYEKTTLKENQSSIIKIFNLISEYKRVAITCFEKEVCMCHRSRVAKSLSQIPNWNLPIKNL